MGKKIGIDLGTTNTSISIANEVYGGGVQATPVQAVQFNGNKNPIQNVILPSNMYVDENQKEYIGLIGKELREQFPTRVISNSKRFIGTETIMQAGGKKYKSKDVAEHILNACRKSIERYGFNNEEDVITITVPASFNVDQVKDTIDAANNVGFNKVNIIPEPTAALIDFINSERAVIESERRIDFSKKKRIMVFDLGGGTCDVSVIEVFEEGRKLDFSEIAIGRYDELGGVDFDIMAAKHLLKLFCKERNVDFKSLDDAQKRRMVDQLKVFAEKAKENISGNIELGFGDDIPYEQYIMNFYNGEDVYFKIDRKEYDEATKSLYKKAEKIISYDDLKKSKNIVDPILNTLRDYDISTSSIDFVFLTGGMSKYETVKKKLMEIMKIDETRIIVSPYPLESVSRGAAIYQYYDTTINELKNRTVNHKINDSNLEKLKEPETKIDITKVMASAVMVDVSEGLPVTLIEANEKVPCNNVIYGKLKTTSPSGITINIYEGKDCNDWKMKLQNNRKVLFKNPVEIGTPIDIQYNIDENKYLTMSVKVKDEVIKIEQNM